MSNTRHTLASAIAECVLVSSNERLERVMKIRRHLPGLEWWRLLGLEWNICDNRWKYRGALRDLLRDATREQLDAMMTPDELEQLAALPDLVPIYRGCYTDNADGLSWSTERDIAAKFPSLMGYRMDGTPILRAGRVDRERAVLKLDRGEFEVIAHDAHSITESGIEPRLTPTRRRGTPC